MTDILDETARVFDHGALSFTARRGPFLKLLLVNTLLTMITFGIYRFWGKTRVRKYLWHNVRLLDDPLEYTGTGRELFLGFLIVVAILFPLGLIYGAIDFLIPPSEMILRYTVEGLYYAAIFALIQIGFYRMWRYRLSRTLWRGIRFGLDGSSWTFLKLATGWTLLCALTLGVAYPWMRMDLWRYQVSHARLGTERFAFAGKGRELLVPWLLVLIPLGLYVGMILAAAIFTTEMSDARHGDRMAELHGMVIEHAFAFVWLGILGGVGLVALPFTYFNYAIRQARLLVSATSLGETTFCSALPYWRLLGFILLCIAVSLVLFTPLILAIAASPAAGLEIFMLVGGASLLALLILPTIWAVIFSFELLKQLVLTTKIDNAHHIEAVTQGERADIKTGEGLADAFDIGAF